MTKIDLAKIDDTMRPVLKKDGDNLRVFGVPQYYASPRGIALAEYIGQFSVYESDKDTGQTIIKCDLTIDDIIEMVEDGTLPRKKINIIIRKVRGRERKTYRGWNQALPALMELDISAAASQNSNPIRNVSFHPMGWIPNKFGGHDKNKSNVLEIILW